MYIYFIVSYAIIGTYLPSPFKYLVSLFLLSVTATLCAILPFGSVKGAYDSVIVPPFHGSGTPRVSMLTLHLPAKSVVLAKTIFCF